MTISTVFPTFVVILRNHRNVYMSTLRCNGYKLSSLTITECDESQQGPTRRQDNVRTVHYSGYDHHMRRFSVEQCTLLSLRESRITTSTTVFVTWYMTHDSFDPRHGHRGTRWRGFFVCIMFSRRVQGVILFFLFCLDLIYFLGTYSVSSNLSNLDTIISILRLILM